MKRLIASFLILSVSILSAYSILILWKGVHLYLANPSKERLLKAVRFTPSNPNLFYRLALHYQWNMEASDLKTSLHYLGMAIERNPLEQSYWLSLAKVLNRMGDVEASEQAMKKAALVFPTGYTGRWTTANLLVQQGALERALPHFSYILAHFPEQRRLVYEVLLKAVQDQDVILGKVIPADPDALNHYLDYLYEAGDKETAVKAWAKKVSLGLPGERKEALRHIDFLISRNALSEAFQVWKARLKEEGLPLPSEGNLVTNGGFEKEKIMGGGFDWRMAPVQGASMSFDPSVAFEGKQSLKISFDGKDNIDFHHLYQVVPWKSDRDYLLKVHMKTKEVTTKSGIKMEIIGIGPALQASSESLIGDQGWRELTLAFHTPPQSQGGIIRVRREKTDKFDRFLSGTVWLDAITLKEK
jgi:tetratricopeptide (TPR) repeat protein